MESALESEKDDTDIDFSSFYFSFPTHGMELEKTQFFNFGLAEQECAGLCSDGIVFCLLQHGFDLHYSKNQN